MNAQIIPITSDEHDITSMLPALKLQATAMVGCILASSTDPYKAIELAAFHLEEIYRRGLAHGAIGERKRRS